MSIHQADEYVDDEPRYLPPKQRVEAFRYDGGERYCPGIVKKYHAHNGTYDILFQDKNGEYTLEETVAWELMKVYLCPCTRVHAVTCVRACMQTHT